MATRGRAPRPAGPVIGLSCYGEQARWGVWDTAAVVLPRSYVTSVRDSGGVAVLLPPGELTPAEADAVVAGLDGLIIAGGADVDPAAYDAEPDPQTAGTRPDRDAAELALIAAADRADLPVLGICRGAQLLAVAAGGSLIQHLPDVVGTDRHRERLGVFSTHPARFATGSLAERMLGDSLDVNSHHHQAIGDPGALTVTGWAFDDTIEVVEDPSRPFWVGVQWHPEETGDARLFRALVEAAAGSSPLP